jgi:hypothetical protein
MQSKPHKNKGGALREGMEDYLDETNALIPPEMMDEEYPQKVRADLLGVLSLPKGEERERLTNVSPREVALYREKWAKLIPDAMNKLLNQPDIDKDVFMDWLKERIQMRFKQCSDAIKKQNEAEIAKWGKLVDSFRNYRAAMKQLVAECPDPRQLFVRLFSAQPQGYLEVRTEAANLHFDFDERQDFMTAYYGRRALSHELSSDHGIGGFQSEYFIDGKPIIITAIDQTTIPHDDEDLAESVYIHEEQHALNRLLEEEWQGIVYAEHLQQALKEGDTHAIFRLTEKVLHEVRHEDMERRARDEIFAFLKEYTSPKPIYDYLTKSEEENGLYDYAGDYKKDYRQLLRYLLDGLNGRSMQKNAYKEYKPIFEEAIDRILERDYKKLLEESLKAVSLLLDYYSSRKVIGLLLNQPLPQWSSIAELMTQKKR